MLVLCSFNPFRSEDKFLRKVSNHPHLCPARQSRAHPFPFSSRCWTGQTSIVGTIGPAVNSVAKVAALMDAGMSIGQSIVLPSLAAVPPSLPTLALTELPLSRRPAIRAVPVRINFSHGSHATHQNEIDMIRAAIKGEWTSVPLPAPRLGRIRPSSPPLPRPAHPTADPKSRPLAIAVDTKGAGIRGGWMTDDLEVAIPQGHQFRLTVDPAYARAGTRDIVFVDYVRRQSEPELAYPLPTAA